ncbi:hypothetical protein E4T39_07008 [Aureobasidium subglaciale]|nr:hypothetical protein E4T39_07008 [Aureobasidium subglaciale]
MTSSSTPQHSSPVDAAITFSCHENFHQSIILQATADHKALRITYATTTNFSNEELPVILFCHPMGAARYLTYEFEYLAVSTGVRVVCIDRPSFGGSTPVELSQRVDVFLKAVPAVLEKLRVKHVSLLSHSAGTIYLFNVLLRLPHYLHPERPFAGVIAPWVHPKHSNAGLMQVVDKLPTSWLANFHTILGFINGSIAPSLQFSSAMLGLTSGLDEEDCKTWHGMNKETWDEVGKSQVKYSGLEDKSGISADAQLCMQKDAKDWGVYADLPSLISSLSGVYPQETRKLTLQACYAETDVMIGKGGQEYFERCWAEGNDNAEVEFESRVVKGTDHDSILPAEKGCIEDIFKQVKRLNG